MLPPDKYLYYALQKKDKHYVRHIDQSAFAKWTWVPAMAWLFDEPCAYGRHIHGEEVFTISTNTINHNSLMVFTPNGRTA